MKNITIIVVALVALGIAYLFLKDRIKLAGLPGDLSIGEIPKQPSYPTIRDYPIKLPGTGKGRYIPFPL